MKKSLLTFAIFLIVGMANAQTHLGFNFQMLFPTEEYAQNTKDVGVGLGMEIWVPVGYDVPVYLGLDLGYNLLGRTQKRINEKAQIMHNGTVIDEIPINYKVVTNNSSFHTHLGVKAKLPLEIVQPYVQGLVGFNYLYTRTKIFDESQNRGSKDEDGQITSSKQLGDFTFSYGGGAGVHVLIADNVGIDLKVIYLRGKEAEYYRKEDIKNWKVTLGSDNTNPADAEIKTITTASRTDMFYGSLGIVFDF